MDRHSNDLLIVATVAIVAALVVLLEVDTVLRPILTLPLVLFVPGYAITAALFPDASGEATARGSSATDTSRFWRRLVSHYELSVGERFLFSLGLSLTVTAVGGLLLNLTSLGLQSALWTILLCAITLAAGAIAFLRRPAAARTMAVSIDVNVLNARQSILFGLAAVAVVTAVAVARTPAPETGLEGYTALWIQPDDVDRHTIRLGVNSNEFSTTVYTLELTTNGRVIDRWPAITLEPGETWQAEVQIASPQTTTGPLTAVLYRRDAPDDVYRRVEWWPETEQEAG